MRRDRRQGGPGGVVDAGICYVQPGRMFEQGSAEGIDIRARRRVGYAYNLHPVCFQQCVKVEIAGVVHQDSVARFQQKSANQVDGVRAGFREHDLFKRGFGPDASQPPRQELPKGRAAKR
ncbi:hypothetical protein D3C81_1143480 [compost metagenome]